MYSSYFIGIPLSLKFQQDFEDLLTDISKISSFFKTTYPKTPHITVCYLDKQSNSNLPKIAENVSTHLNILKGVELSISGLGYFGGDVPKIMFLNVQQQPQLQEFNQIISKSLSVYSKTSNKLPFYPHITVAWVGNPKAQAIFKASRLELESRLKKVNWKFDITELVLYGVDSAKQPEYQEQLISIIVK